MTTVFGKEVKKRLIDMEMPQSWLIKEVRERTGLYCDRAYLYKILTGQVAPPRIVTAICETLDIPNDVARGDWDT